MRTTALVLALLSLAAVTAVAQVPRTINYQGRVNGPGGPLNDTRQMTIKLYTSATGGTAIYTDIQNVTFRDGVFTVAIGGGTSGQIPATLPFDQEYWMGVTIASFNGGQEIAPRFILRSSPYSLRAVLADSSASSARAANATRADSAGALHVPAQLIGAEGVNPLFEVKNNGKGAALRTEGSTYASVSVGIDSTSRHFVAGETLGAQSIPAPGGYYRDNAPLAWGTIASNGTLVSGFGMTVSQQKDSSYEVTLINSPQTVAVSGFDLPQFAPVITPGGSIPPGGESPSPVFTSWGYKRNSNGGVERQTIVVKFLNVQVSGQNFVSSCPFSIVVFGRP